MNKKPENNCNSRKEGVCLHHFILPEHCSVLKGDFPARKNSSHQERKHRVSTFGVGIKVPLWFLPPRLAKLRPIEVARN